MMPLPVSSNIAREKEIHIEFALPQSGALRMRPNPESLLDANFFENSEVCRASETLGSIKVLSLTQSLAGMRYKKWRPFMKSLEFRSELRSQKIGTGYAPRGSLKQTYLARDFFSRLSAVASPRWRCPLVPPKYSPRLGNR